MQEVNLIETPENVELEQRLAGIGSRFVAGLVDNLVIIGVYVLLFLVLIILLALNPLDLITHWDWSHTWMLAVVILALFATYWGYFVFFELRTNGQSPGKKRAKIRVVKEGGGPITFTDVAIRNLLRVVDGIGVYGIAGLCMFLSRKVQRLGDLAAGTVVISEDIPDYSARTDRRHAVQWQQEVRPEVLRATGLTPEEYRLLLNYWVRRGELTLSARERVLPQILGPILQRRGQAMPVGPITTIESYVEALLSSTSAPLEDTSGTPSPGGKP